MALNPKWSRWTFASVSKHLHDQADADSVPLVVEMGNKRTPTWENAASRVETTITGPRFLETSNGSYRVEVDVFAIIDSLRANGYDHIEVVGKVAAWLNQCILVKDYGDTGAVEVGTLTLLSGTDGTLDVVNLKPAQTDDRFHSTINARYSSRFKA